LEITFSELRFRITSWELSREADYVKAYLGKPEENRKIYDAAVPTGEAQQVATMLKDQGRSVNVHFYDNEGHGFTKPEIQIDVIQRTVAWFDQCLMRKGPVSDCHSPSDNR